MRAKSVKSVLSFIARCSVVEMMERRMLLSGAPLTGAVIGTSGSYNNHGTVAADAFDENLNTYFDAPTASGSWAGLDLGTPAVVQQISFAPRSGWASRMVGGVFQGSSTADFSSGVTTLATITTTPAAGTLTSIPITNTNSFEFVRYLGPANSYCDVAEVQFYGQPGAGGITLQPNGTLVINGTNGSDSIGFNIYAPYGESTNTVQANVNGESANFNLSSISSVVINTFGGNDQVMVNETRYVNGFSTPDTPSITINSGDGSDSFNTFLQTGSGSETGSVAIYAGNGDDSFTLNGNGTFFSVLAGNGNDTFTTAVTGNGGYGDNYTTIQAGNGNDAFYVGTGGAENVRIDAGIGQDQIESPGVNSYVNGVVAGESFTLSPQKSFVVGKAYADVNGDGQYETGEPTVANEPLTFENSRNGNVTVTTDSTGGYIVPLVADTHVTYGPNATSYVLTPGELLSGVNYALPVLVGGTVIGTAGSYQNDGNTISKAFDGNLSTYFDGPTGHGNYAGRNLGTKTVITSIAYAPRSGYASRMVGGVFQGSNSANFTGAVNLYTITSAPAAGVLTYQTISNSTPFQYVRYVGPNGSFGDVAEVTFFSTPPSPAGGSLNSTGILTVTGTSGADNIQVSVAYYDSSQTITTTVNGLLQTFDATKVNGIVINSGDGNDTITSTGQYVTDVNNVDPTNNLATTINTGSGNDSILANVYTDAGPYEAPPDVVNLGSGTDSVTIEQDGTSTVHGGAGNDTITGDSTDGFGLYVWGGSGNTTVIGGPFTTDYFYGGTGTNTYYEGPDYDSGTVDVNLNGPQFSNIQYFYDGYDGKTITVEGGPTTRSIVLNGANTAATVTGGSGDEYIDVFSQTATINAGNGNNSIYLDAQQSGVVNGGTGNDTIDAADSGGAVTVNGGGGNDTAYTNPAETVNNIQIVNPQYTGKFAGTLIATAGSYQNDGNTAAKAVDGNLSTYFDGPTANGDYVELDLGAYHLVGSISFAPRAGWSQRMVNGTFEVSDTANFANATPLFTISTAPTAGVLTTYTFTQPIFARYIRYVAPDGSFGDIAEFQVNPPPATGPVKLTGSIIGTPGSYRNHGTTIANAFDANFSTYFDAPDASGDWVGLDLGSAKTATQVQYAPRAGYETRMVGGKIQASNTADFSSGVVTLYTITSAPAAGELTAQPINNTTAYRYYRFIGPANSYCDISELEFDG